MPRWTAEARKRQSELIRGWQPWRNSTGPVTEQGKAITAKNRCPSDYVFFGGVQIRADTRKGQKLVHELMQALALHRLKLISDEIAHQQIEALLRKNGYLETE